MEFYAYLSGRMHNYSKMKHFLIPVVALMLAAMPAAYGQRSNAKPEAEKPAEAEKTPELTVTSGLFGVSQNEKDWYFDIPDEILGRRILAVTRFVSNTPGASEYGGEEVNEVMIYWEKASR